MDRRNFLCAQAPLAFGRALAWQASERTPRLRITDVRVVPLRKIRDVGSLEPAWNPGGRMAFSVGGGSYVEVLTDQGLSGIGPGLDPALLPAVRSQLVGEDPFDTERHHARRRYWSHAPYLELLHDPPTGDYRHRFAIMKDPPLVDKGGFVPLPQRPGLGEEINPDLI